VQSHMAKVTVEMNENLASVLNELAQRQGSTKAAVIRRSLTLMKLIEDQKDEGYKLGLSKNGQLEREILTP
jgi:predicted transcriptional regulator